MLTQPLRLLPTMGAIIFGWAFAACTRSAGPVQDAATQTSDGPDGVGGQASTGGIGEGAGGAGLGGTGGLFASGTGGGVAGAGVAGGGGFSGQGGSRSSAMDAGTGAVSAPRQVAIQALLAFLFESCDIFEGHPEQLVQT